LPESIWARMSDGFAAQGAAVAGAKVVGEKWPVLQEVLGEGVREDSLYKWPWLICPTSGKSG
jgi:hypothetical protein